VLEAVNQVDEGIPGVAQLLKPYDEMSNAEYRIMNTKGHK